MVRTCRSTREVYNEVLERLTSAPCTESISPKFSDQLWSHFHLLPSRIRVCSEPNSLPPSGQEFPVTARGHLDLRWVSSSKINSDQLPLTVIGPTCSD